MNTLSYEDNGTPPIAQINSSDLVFISDAASTLESQEPSILDQPLDVDTILSIADSLQQGLTLNQVVHLFSSFENSTLPPSSPTTHIDLSPSDTIQVIPSPTNERMLIGGPTGCGKSTFASDYARTWQKLFPDRLIHIFARQANDAAFEGIDCEEIVVTPDILERDLGIHDFVDTLVIFDDMDNLQDKDCLSYIHKLLNDLMACGRKQNIYVIYMTHLFLNRNKTQIPLNETNKIVFFNGMGDRQNRKVLTEYAQMSKSDVDCLTSLPSKWCCLERSRPRYVVHEKGVFLL